MNPPHKKILLVTSNFPRWPGDSTTPFILHLAQDLKQLGWEVDVLAPHAPGAKKSENIDGIQVDRFQYLWPENAQTVCYQGGALINLRKNKSNLLKLPFLVFFEWLNLCYRLKKNKYDLIHSHWILPQGFVGVLAAKLFKVPHIITVHGGDVFALKGKWLSRFKSFSIKKCDAITVNSSATFAAVQALYPTPNNLKIIPMGVKIAEDVDSEYRRNLRKQYKKGDGPLLIFVGRLVEEKGIADFIQATKILKNQFNELTAVIVGEGQDRPSFEKLANQLNLQDTIYFTGWVDPNRISDYLAIADIFIGPSRTGPDGWKEAQGLTFLEAMAAKTTVIATQSGGMVDFVKEGETGFLVDEKNPEQIATAVKRIVGQPQLLESLKNNAYRLVVAKYSREVSAREFSTLYETLVMPS